MFQVEPLSLDEPAVTICFQPSGVEYRIRKEVLIAPSTYFRIMFDHFLEGQTDRVVLEEIDGVVSPRGFEILMEWIYSNAIEIPDAKTPGEYLTAAIEVARLAEYFQIGDIEDKISEELAYQIRQANPSKPCAGFDAPHDRIRSRIRGGFRSIVKDNSYMANLYDVWITEKHIRSAVQLRKGHGVRRILAAVSAGALLDAPDQKFARRSRECPDFGDDLLMELRETILSLELCYMEDTAKDMKWMNDPSPTPDNLGA
ncbi:hypothetical protein POX_a01011 [Penicillium oxalicum]|uniref:hypothetical protein n=1 Tax=Penicillium oxalicum TaxID=69781 RepID=UPI0020B7DB21|nr:hypothetical protein POX_a01011 [Penicillium oxalicum]KAI2794412.1 hypothetical protein POX_a01011 [Penicillium oxalicum]